MEAGWTSGSSHSGRSPPARRRRSRARPAGWASSWKPPRQSPTARLAPSSSRAGEMAEMTRPEGRALPTGTVTFLLTDIESSTQRWERSPDAMKQAMVAHDELLSRAIPQHAGTHVESGREGDSVLAAFTRATDAVACAIQVQRELAARTWPEGADLHLRMAIHSGEVEARSGHYYGQAVYRCARLLATAHGDQVLVSHATRDLIVDSLPAEVALRDLGSPRLRDLPRP